MFGDLFGCSHKYGKVTDDGYQYCEKCGIAIVAPVNVVLL